MGFGILLIGYFLAFITSLAGSYFFVDIIGAAMMVYALKKLSAYSDKFARTVPSAVIFTFISLFAAILSTLKVGDIVLAVLNPARAATSLMLHIFMFSAITDMAAGADDPRLAGKAKRNVTIITVYYALYIVITVLKPVFDLTLQQYCTVFMYFYGVIAIVLNLLLIHSAYARLYIEGTQERYAETAQFKKSRFEFINKIHERYAASQKKAYEENYQLMKQTRDYVAANRHKIPDKKKKKK